MSGYRPGASFPAASTAGTAIFQRDKPGEEPDELIVRKLAAESRQQRLQPHTGTQPSWVGW